MPWGRSTGALGAALTVELARVRDRRGVRRRASGRSGCAGRWTRPGRSTRGFDADGVSNAHRHRDQDQYRGPARRLQLTLDLLGKIAWAAAALRRVPPGRRRRVTASRRTRTTTAGSASSDHRAAGVWAHRSAGADFVLPLVGASRSHYLPAPYQPGTWEVPVDQDLPCWTPLVLAGLGRYTAAGVPAAHAPRGRRAHRALGDAGRRRG